MSRWGRAIVAVVAALGMVVLGGCTSMTSAPAEPTPIAAGTASAEPAVDAAAPQRYPQERAVWIDQGAIPRGHAGR